MNRDEAKLILQSYRPGGRDAGDPYFAPALALAKQDAELAAWFAEQQALDARISGALQQLRVPSRLKAEILAAAETKESPVATWWRNLFSRQSPVSWALAAVILILLSVALFWKKPAGQSGFADYAAQMVNAAVNDPHHVDIEASNMKQAVAWLSAHRGEGNLTLPTTFDGNHDLMGCRVLDWHGQKVSMLCYSVQGTKHVDVFVAEANIFADAPPLDQPQFAMSGGMPTVSWTHDGKVYLAVSHGDNDILKNLLGPEKVSLIKWKLPTVHRPNFG